VCEYCGSLDKVLVNLKAIGRAHQERLVVERGISIAHFAVIVAGCSINGIVNEPIPTVSSLVALAFELRHFRHLMLVLFELLCYNVAPSVFNLSVVEGLDEVFLSCEYFQVCRAWPHKFHVPRRAKRLLLGLLWTQMVWGRLILGVIVVLDRAVCGLINVLEIASIPHVGFQR